MTYRTHLYFVSSAHQRRTVKHRLQSAEETASTWTWCHFLESSSSFYCPLSTAPRPPHFKLWNTRMGQRCALMWPQLALCALVTSRAYRQEYLTPYAVDTRAALWPTPITAMDSTTRQATVVVVVVVVVVVDMSNASSSVIRLRNAAPPSADASTTRWKPF